MSSLKYSEQLQEALLNLERTRCQETKLREESDAVLQGLSALVSAASRQEVLSVLTRTFQKLISCKDCWVLSLKDDRLKSEVNNTTFPVKEGFSRVLNGGVLNAYNVRQVPEWQDVLIDDTVSALHLPLQFSSSKGMLIITSERCGAFTQESIELAKRIIPFSEQAVSKISYIEQVHAREMDEQRTLMRQILDNAPIGVFLLNEDKKVKFVNRAFCSATGITESRFIAAEHYSDVLPDAVAKQCMASDEACVKSGGLSKSRETIPCVDGKEHIYDVTKLPVQSQNGEMTSIIGIAVDITEQIERATEKKQMQEQLLHTQKLESLGVLAGGIAHDFNNILTAIMGHAALAESKSINDPIAVEQHLKKVVAATEKAADLCKQMLAYSGKGQFVVKPINLSQQIESILNILEVSLNKGVLLKLLLTEKLPLIEADASQIHQVIMNLVTNANEAIGTNSGFISINTGVMTVDGEYLEQCICADDVKPGRFTYVEVTDTGCGMGKEIAEKIFDPFYTTKFTGRGLGMSAVMGIVRGHYGALNLTSKIDEGTTFRILFPVLDADVPDEADKTHDAAHIDHDSTPAILVVDDEETIRELSVMMLNDVGINEIFTAADGREAVDIYKKHADQIDIVLLDYTMPHMDGEEAFKQLQLINPEVKVILASGYSKQSMQEKFTGQGLAGVIQKPYHMGDLSEKVYATFKKHTE